MSLNSLIILSGMSFDFETFLESNSLIAVDICSLPTFLKEMVEFNSVHLFFIASILGRSLYLTLYLYNLLIKVVIYIIVVWGYLLILDSKSDNNIDKKLILNVLASKLSSMTRLLPSASVFDFCTWFYFQTMAWQFSKAFYFHNHHFI